jgi:hypothetical protein
MDDASEPQAVLTNGLTVDPSPDGPASAPLAPRRGRLRAALPGLFLLLVAAVAIGLVVLISPSASAAGSCGGG